MRRDYEHKEDKMTKKERKEMAKFIDLNEDQGSAFGGDQFCKDQHDSEAEEEMAVQEFLEALEANKKREQQREERIRQGIRPRDQMTLFDMYARNHVRQPRMVMDKKEKPDPTIDTARFTKRRHTSKPVKEFRCVVTKKQRLICTKHGCGNYREPSQWLCFYCNEEKRLQSKPKKKKKRTSVNRKIKSTKTFLIIFYTLN